MNVSIRRGFSVSSSEPERVSELKGLESLGIIKLKQEEWQICKKCGACNLIDNNFRTEKSAICINCGKIIELSKHVEKRYTIETLDYRKIQKICQEALTGAIGEENRKYEKDQRVWTCNCDGKSIPVFISSFSSYNPYLGQQSDFSWLCILLDWEKEKGNVNYYNKVHFARFEDILYNKDKLRENLKGLTTSFVPNPAFELRQKFDSFIASIKPTDFERFEKEFVDDFIKGIQEKIELLKTFFNFLSFRKNTIANSKVVLVGGPGNPDFVSLNLMEYLQECLRPEKIGEAKRYFRATSFTVEDFGKVLVHAKGGDTISIISTNRIQPEVWRSVIDSRTKENHYKHVLIEKDTILLLMSVLKLDYLLSL